MLGRWWGCCGGGKNCDYVVCGEDSFATMVIMVQVQSRIEIDGVGDVCRGLWFGVVPGFRWEEGERDDEDDDGYDCDIGCVWGPDSGLN